MASSDKKFLLLESWVFFAPIEAEDGVRRMF